VGKCGENLEKRLELMYGVRYGRNLRSVGKVFGKNGNNLKKTGTRQAKSSYSMAFQS
jgi:hypothetical protein